MQSKSLLVTTAHVNSTGWLAEWDVRWHSQGRAHRRSCTPQPIRSCHIRGEPASTINTGPKIQEQLPGSLSDRKEQHTAVLGTEKM